MKKDNGLMFHEQAAIAAMAALIYREGMGHSEVCNHHAVRAWSAADELVRTRDLSRVPETVGTEPEVREPQHPADEWAVYEKDGRKVAGFVSVEEAEIYAAGREGAEVVKLSGPKPEELVIQ
jgi:hypothetical protein